MDAHRRRAWEPIDFFFDIPDVDRPSAPVERGCHCLLFGPEGSGKTTLLFQHALTVAKRDPDARVLFVCRRDAVETSPPHLSRSSADLDAASRISMKYLSSDVELCKLASVMHLLPPDRLPTLIIVDNFSGFFPSAPDDGGASRGGGATDPSDLRDHRDRRQRELRVARAVAALHECASSIRRRPNAHSHSDDADDADVDPGGASFGLESDDRNRGGFAASLDDVDRLASSDDDDGCLLLVAETTEPGTDAPPMAYLHQKWFTCAMAVRAVGERDAGCSFARGKQFEIARAWRASGQSARGDETMAIRFAVDNAGGVVVPIGFV
jgi:energy-coupling factor transporter ATP-binding protein EcfA2